MSSLQSRYGSLERTRAIFPSTPFEIQALRKNLIKCRDDEAKNAICEIGWMLISMEKYRWHPSAARLISMAINQCSLALEVSFPSNGPRYCYKNSALKCRTCLPRSFARDKKSFGRHSPKENLGNTSTPEGVSTSSSTIYIPSSIGIDVSSYSSSVSSVSHGRKGIYGQDELGPMPNESVFAEKEFPHKSSSAMPSNDTDTESETDSFPTNFTLSAHSIGNKGFLVSPFSSFEEWSDDEYAVEIVMEVDSTGGKKQAKRTTRHITDPEILKETEELHTALLESAEVFANQMKAQIRRQKAKHPQQQSQQSQHPQQQNYASPSQSHSLSSSETSSTSSSLSSASKLCSCCTCGPIPSTEALSRLVGGPNSSLFVSEMESKRVRPKVECLCGDQVFWRLGEVLQALAHLLVDFDKVQQDIVEQIESRRLLIQQTYPYGPYSSPDEEELSSSFSSANYSSTTTPAVTSTLTDPSLWAKASEVRSPRKGAFTSGPEAPRGVVSPGKSDREQNRDDQYILDDTYADGDCQADMEYDTEADNGKTNFELGFERPRRSRQEYVRYQENSEMELEYVCDESCQQRHTNASPHIHSHLPQPIQKNPQNSSSKNEASLRRTELFGEGQLVNVSATAEALARSGTLTSGSSQSSNFHKPSNPSNLSDISNVLHSGKNDSFSRNQSQNKPSHGSGDHSGVSNKSLAPSANFTTSTVTSGVPLGHSPKCGTRVALYVGFSPQTSSSPFNSAPTASSPTNAGSITGSASGSSANASASTPSRRNTLSGLEGGMKNLYGGPGLKERGQGESGINPVNLFFHHSDRLFARLQNISHIISPHKEAAATSSKSHSSSSPTSSSSMACSSICTVHGQQSISSSCRHHIHATMQARAHSLSTAQAPGLPNPPAYPTSSSASTLPSDIVSSCSIVGCGPAGSCTGFPYTELSAQFPTHRAGCARRLGRWASSLNAWADWQLVALNEEVVRAGSGNSHWAVVALSEVYALYLRSARLFELAIAPHVLSVPEVAAPGHTQPPEICWRSSFFTSQSTSSTSMPSSTSTSPSPSLSSTHSRSSSADTGSLNLASTASLSSFSSFSSSMSSLHDNTISGLLEEEKVKAVRTPTTKGIMETDIAVDTLDKVGLDTNSENEAEWSEEIVNELMKGYAASLDGLVAVRLLCPGAASTSALPDAESAAQWHLHAVVFRFLCTLRRLVFHHSSSHLNSVLRAIVALSLSRSRWVATAAARLLEDLVSLGTSFSAEARALLHAGVRPPLHFHVIRARAETTQLLARSQLDFSCAIAHGQQQDMLAWVEANLESLHPENTAVLDAIAVLDAEQRTIPYQHIYVADRSSPYYTGLKPIQGTTSVWAGEQWDLLRAFAENWDACCNGIYFATGFRFPAAAHLDRRGRPFRRGKANPYRVRYLTQSASLRRSMRTANDLVTEATVASLIIKQDPRELFENWDWVGHGAFGDVFVAVCITDIIPTLSLQQSLSFAYSRNNSSLGTGLTTNNFTATSALSRQSLEVASSSIRSYPNPNLSLESVQEEVRNENNVTSSTDFTSPSTVSTVSTASTASSVSSTSLISPTFSSPSEQNASVGIHDTMSKHASGNTTTELSKGSSVILANGDNSHVDDHDDDKNHKDDKNEDDDDGVVYNPYEDDESSLHHALMQVSSFSNPAPVPMSVPASAFGSQPESHKYPPKSAPKLVMATKTPDSILLSSTSGTANGGLVSSVASMASYAASFFVSSAKKSSGSDQSESLDQQSNSNQRMPDKLQRRTVKPLPNSPVKGEMRATRLTTGRDTTPTLMSEVETEFAKPKAKPVPPSHPRPASLKPTARVGVSSSTLTSSSTPLPLVSPNTSSSSSAASSSLHSSESNALGASSQSIPSALASPSLKLLDHLQNSGFDLPPSLQQARRRAQQAITSSLERTRQNGSSSSTSLASSASLALISSNSTAPILVPSSQNDTSSSSYSFTTPTPTAPSSYSAMASTLSIPRSVAIKQVHVDTAEGWQSGMKETLMLSSCSHENVVGYLGTYFHDQSLWIIMEFCDGGTLAQLCSVTKLNEACIAYVCREVLKGLSFLHSRARIHRDIKPANILLNLDGQVRIGDLGLLVEQDDTVTRTSLAGTENFMAPEMISGEGYDSKADIWSLGCSVLEMCNGKAPYKHLSTLGCLFRLVTDPPPTLARPQSWSPELNDFVAQLLRSNPHKRPSADQLLNHPFIQMAASQEHLAALFVHVFLTKALRSSGLM